MADLPTDDAAREDQVDDFIASYLEAIERGESPDARAYIAQHPELAPELSLFFADRAEFQRAVGEISPAARAINDGPVSLSNTPVPGPDQPTLDYKERPAGGAKPMPDRFGDYELLEEIARGGMGVVYKARQVTLNRTVAIKMILAGQLATTQDVKRFHIEAEAAADLDHPNIVPIYEVGRHDGQHYFAMAYVEGPSLAARVAEDPLPPREAAELVKAVAGAVHYAHERGVIHRDLKPGNILLQTGREVSGGVVSGKNAGAIQRGGSRRGTCAAGRLAEFIPKVADFGLARRLEAHSSLTGAGQILGTPSYMPPEQATADFDQIGPASDIYSLGAVLYCLVTGQPPFLATSAFETLVQVLEQEPAPPRQLNSSLPRDLEAICLKCLRKAPEERYASAAELAADLRRFLAGEPVVARRTGAVERTVKWVKRRPTTAASIGMTVVAVVGGAILAVQGAAARALADAEKAASREQAQTCTEGLLTALPAAVPRVVERLRPLREFALPLLRERLGDAALDGTRRLRAAYALADEGEAPLTFLLDAIPTAPPAECRNLLAAIGHAKAPALTELLDRARSSGDRVVKSRYAIVALQLGDPNASQEALALRGDPMERTGFIETFADWHGELRGPLRLLRDTDDEAFRSGMCAALGAIPPEELDPSDVDVVTSALEELFDHAPDGGTHSASAWALGQYGRTPPPIEPTPSPPSGRRWFVNGQGMTLVEVPPGEFEMGLPQAEFDQLIRSTPEQADQRYFPRSTPQHHVRLTNRFYLGAYEVTQRQYQEIMGSNPSPFSEGGTGKGLVAGVDTSQHPVEMVNWFDAVDFCNKLSEKEGLPPYYARVGPNVILLQGNGYHLPTEAEWEFACRAGTNPPWSFGDDGRNLTRHAWFKPDSRNPTQGVGELPPNPYGLHDLYGNVDEWCWDWAADYSADSVTDPLGPSVGANRVLRGCAVSSFAHGVRSAHRSGGPPFERRPNYGFRVARTIEVDDAVLIASNLGFANAQMAQGNPRAALPSYGRAIMTIERLAPEKLSELATRDLLHQALNGLGNAQQQLGDYLAALTSHEKALPIAQERAAEQPEKVEYEIGLAGTYCNIGNALGMLERTDDAISSYGRATALLQGVLGRDPKNLLARLYLRNTHWGHARVLGRLDRHAEAAENWRQAAELDDGKFAYIRMGYGESLARAGDHVAAAAEARQLAENRQSPGDQLYVLARVFSISAAGARDDATLAEAYAVEAVDLLRRAQTAGWFADARNVAALSQDADLSCLRDRDDFRKLVAMAIDEGTKAIRLQQNPSLGFQRRGELFAKNNEPAKAADDFARAFEFAPDEVGLAQTWCYTLFGSGNVAGYQEACRRLRDRFGMSDDPNQVLVLCRVLIQSPDAVADTEFLVQLGQKAVRLNPGQWWPRHVLAGAYLRNGQYEETLNTLDENDALNLVRASNSLVDPWLSQILNDSLRAIALLKLGRASEARLVLERVDESSEQHLKSAPERPFGEITPFWWNWYPIQAFRREADELMVLKTSDTDAVPESANPAAGAPTGLFSDVMRNTTTGVESPPWLVVSSGQFGHLNLIAQDAEGKSTTPLTKDLASATEPSWSPNGGKIAFTSYSHGGSRLQLLDVEELKVTPLDVSTASNRGACWSPDGKRIAFTSVRSGNWDIHVMDADGKNVVNLTNDPGYDADAAWSPDGTRIAFASNRTGVFRIWLMNADGTNPVDLLGTDQLTHLYPAWSPDGKQLTFGGRGDDDTVQLFVVNADGTSPVQLTHAGAINTYSAWSPDGMHLAYLRLGVPDAVSGVAPVGDLMIYDTAQKTHNVILTGSAWARPCWIPAFGNRARSSD